VIRGGEDERLPKDNRVEGKMIFGLTQVAGVVKNLVPWLKGNLLLLVIIIVVLGTVYVVGRVHGGESVRADLTPKLEALNEELGGCHASVLQLEAAIAQQNEQLDKLKAAATARQEEARKALAAAAKEVAEHESRAKFIAEIRQRELASSDQSCNYGLRLVREQLSRGG
jgi:hypothetical protein